jgi:hypothetical protein
VLIPLLSFLTQSSNNIPKRTQASIYILRLTNPFLIRSIGEANIQPLTAGEVDEVQASFTPFASSDTPVNANVDAADAQGEDGMRTRGSFVHQRRCYASTGLSEG